jgi:hypothetical protein
MYPRFMFFANVVVPVLGRYVLVDAVVAGLRVPTEILG